MIGYGQVEDRTRTREAALFMRRDPSHRDRCHVTDIHRGQSFVASFNVDRIWT